MKEKEYFLTREEFNKMKQLRATGIPLREIAQAIGRCYSTVQRNIKKPSYRSYVRTVVHGNRAPRIVSVPEGAKQCSRCGKVKPLTEFDKSPKAKLGVSSYCKECRRVTQRESYRKMARKIAATRSTKTPQAAKEVAQIERSMARIAYAPHNVTNVAPAPVETQDTNGLKSGDAVYVEERGRVKAGTVVAFNNDRSKCVARLSGLRPRRVVRDVDEIYKDDLE